MLDYFRIKANYIISIIPTLTMNFNQIGALFTYNNTLWYTYNLYYVDRVISMCHSDYVQSMINFTGYLYCTDRGRPAALFLTDTLQHFSYIIQNSIHTTLMYMQFDVHS